MALPIYLLPAFILFTRAQVLGPRIPYQMFFGVKFIGCPLYTCVGKCSQRSTIVEDESLALTCKCDDYCVIFGDCCHSYFTLCHLFTKTSALIEFMNNGGRFNNEDQRTKDLKYFAERSRCVAIRFESRPFVMQGIIMIAKCNFENIDNSIRDKCEGEESAFPNDIPVSLADEPFITFKNPYCAACNTLSIGKQFVHWHANIQCQLSSLTVIRTYADLKDQEERCYTLVTKPETSIVRKCETEFEDSVCTSDHRSDQGMPNQSAGTKRSTEAPHNVEEMLTDLDASMTDIGIIDYADDSPNVTSTNEENVTISPASSPEAILLEIKEPHNTGDLMDEEVFDIVRQNQVALCRSYIFPHSVIGRNTYKNPHCEGCDMGWDEFKNSSEYADGFFCSFMPRNGASAYFPDSRRVNHHHAVYKGRAIYFSSDLGHVLEPLPQICRPSSFFHPLTERCEPALCPPEFSPYHEACIPNDLQLKRLPSRQFNKHLYITMIATWTGQGSEFENIAPKIVNEIKSLSFNHLHLTDDSSSSAMVNMSRGSKISSLTILQQYTSSPLFQGSTTAKVELTIPLLFGELHDLFADLSYRLGDTSPLDIHNVYVKNYENDKDMSCYNTILETKYNMTTTSFEDYVFVMTDKGLVNLQDTWFTWHSDGENLPHLVEMSVCGDPLIHNVISNTKPSTATATETTTIQSISKKNTERCLNWTTLTDDTFETVKGGVLLQSGQFLKDSQLEPDEDGSTRVCSSDLLAFPVTKSDSSSKVRFKNVSSGMALGLKLLSILISVLRWGVHSGAVYYHLLALSSLLIDIVHLIENSEIVSSKPLLPILLHFSWLFSIYSFLAWSLIVTFNVRKVYKCTCRHLSVALIVPIATVVICATGDSNDPPWNVGYGAYDHLFSVGRDAFIYGYILPVAVGYAANISVLIIKLVRRHDKESSDNFFVYNFVVTSLMAIQFSLASSERLVDTVSIHYYYFTLSLIISWTFIASSISPATNNNIDRPSRYLDSADSSSVTER